MEPYVLVATPARPATAPVFLTMSESIYDSLTYGRRERAFCDDPLPVSANGTGKYAGHAASRNRLIDLFLTDGHTHVLWLDVDLVTVPANLIERLLAISSEEIVAPHIYVERVDPARPSSFRNGGWFYDTGAFIQRGQTRHMWNPNLPGLQEMDSVGCCYLAPAALYRTGARYAPEGDEIEHLSLMRQAKERGYRILTTDSILVEHCYLPKYGEPWHT